jgi:hypothetical protein
MRRGWRFRGSGTPKAVSSPSGPGSCPGGVHSRRRRIRRGLHLPFGIVRSSKAACGRCETATGRRTRTAARRSALDWPSATRAVNVVATRISLAPSGACTLLIESTDEVSKSYCAPARRSSRSTSTCPFFLAHASGVAQGSASASTGSAPRSRYSRTSSMRPQRHAHPSVQQPRHEPEIERLSGENQWCPVEYGMACPDERGI